jgi:hypothetical protein
MMEWYENQTIIFSPPLWGGGRGRGLAGSEEMRTTYKITIKKECEGGFDDIFPNFDPET